MSESITFHSNRYFNYSATFVYLSQHPLWICYAARCVHFTDPQEEEVHSSSWGGTDLHIWQHIHQKKIKPFVCDYISMPRQNIKEQDQGWMQEFWKGRALRISDEGGPTMVAGGVPENFEN